MVGFDEYDRKARLTPGLLAIAPVMLLVITVGWESYPAIAAVGGLLGGAGATYLLAILVRHLGRAVEPGLWSSWGGAPTTQLLRSRTPSENPVLRDAWRQAVVSVTGVTLLSAPEETADPDLADRTIEAAVRQLTHLGQDTNYPLLKAENIQYGFERNFYGMRWAGRAIAGTCLVMLVIFVILAATETAGVDLSVGAVTAGLIVDGFFLLGWVLLPSSRRTRQAADRYANQLLQATVLESHRVEGNR